MKRKKLKKLWKIKKVCNKKRIQRCEKCKHKTTSISGGCRVIYLWGSGNHYPFKWDLPPLPDKTKKKKLADKFQVGGQVAGEQPKINLDIVEALRMGYSWIICEVWNRPEDKKIEVIMGVNIGDQQPYYNTLGQNWKHAIPVPADNADHVKVEIERPEKFPTEMSEERLNKLWKMKNKCSDKWISGIPYCHKCEGFNIETDDCKYNNEYNKDEKLAEVPFPAYWCLPVLYECDEKNSCNYKQ